MTMPLVRVLFLLTISLSVFKSCGQVWPLDMANDSVDDYYEGCKDDMYNLVSSKYTEYEKMNTPGFAEAWKTALIKCNKNGLNVNLSAAIYLYTQDSSFNPKCSYVQFNNDCRKGKEAYLSGDFKFYTLYFFLTEAIKELNKQKDIKTKLFCLTSYRRTKFKFSNVTNKKEIRFGSFTSSSLNMNLTHFGNVSCFKIKTCYGVKVQQYSALKYESEVIIPPYEVFSISKKDKVKNLRCEVVYEVKSKHKCSTLNCSKVAKLKC
ncbi:NAD(P)(+)--arginine ADP-ribosyltransferase 2-like [Hoplias malabaricus]|uniref:NAD(P)(+)--arginine ADP-ribosyltransferase 2-like n=1 Tax=Hoplias malabaricus TaxID=27720 RepID=UPI0034620943